MHAKCFLAKLAVEYSPGRRGKCKGTDVPFEAGDVRVQFDVAGHRSWWKPAEAARWTSEILKSAESGEDLKFDSITGLHNLEPEHGQILLLALRGQMALGDIPVLRREPATKSKPRGAKKAKAALANAAQQVKVEVASAVPSLDAAAAGAAPIARACFDLDASDSDIELSSGGLPVMQAAASSGLD